MQDLCLALQHQLKLAYTANIAQLAVTNVNVVKKPQTILLFFPSTKCFPGACYQMNKGHKSTSFRKISTQDNLLTADQH